MSAAAHQVLTPKQIEQLEKHAEILSSSLILLKPVAEEVPM
jgi:hypothetical protein